MISAELLVDRPEFAIRLVRCRDDRTGWSAPEAGDRHGIVLVRSGGFRRAGRGGEMWADRAVGYAMVPGEEDRFAHPAGGDECTAINVSTRLWRDVAGPARERRAVHVDGRLELAHRLLLRSARDGDVDFAVVERLLRLLVAAAGDAGAEAIGAPGAGTAGSSAAGAGTAGSPAAGVGTPGRRTPRPAARAERAIADAAREALTAGHPSSRGLLPLADLLGVSPYRLSRLFHRHVGVPLTRYRNRLRVGAALHRLEQGEPSLAALAAELGFADQAHLTRTIRSEVGETPHRLRALLAGSAQRR
jgi:AraC-like DNA-binding protein